MTTLIASVNDQVTTRISVLVPWSGVWGFEADFDRPLSDSSLVGRAEVKIGPLTLSGSYDPALTGTYLQQSKCHGHGGVGLWANSIASKTYHDDGLGVRALDVITDIVRDVGEVLGTVTPAIDRLGADWLRRAGQASDALAMAAGGAPWWVDYSGATNVGPRTISEVVGDYEILSVDPRHKQIEIACDDPSIITIGSVLRGRLNHPITVREIAIEVGGGKIRLNCWGSEGNLSAYAQRGRLIRDLAAIVRASLPELPYSKVYRYRVVEQNNGDNRWLLQAVAKAQALPDIGPTRLRGGSGIVAKLQQGAIVGVGFLECNPALPYIANAPDPDDPSWLPIENAIDASSRVSVGTSAAEVDLGSGGASEHATSAEAMVNMLQNFCNVLGVALNGLAVPWPVLGALLVTPANATLIQAAIAACANPATGTIDVVTKAALLAALAAKTNPALSVGWPTVRGA